MGQRGRKKGASGEESRALLLSIAAKEFADKGFYETKVSSIVKEANLSQPAFYLYFDSKEALFGELVDLFRLELFELTKRSRLEPGIDSSTLANRITNGLAAILCFFVEEPDLTRIGFYLADDAEDIKNNLTDQIKDNLIFEQQQGYFCSRLDMSIVAESLVGIIERLTITKLLPGHKTPEILATEIVTLLLHGMITHQSSSSYPFSISD
ncbi:helix-turn-helix domain-containing protein [Neobacillus novalis]|uniref:Helix-turn-helix domain-containing protein n=1 Tax=Neobacillus novalis TaxID=220687 RepID=A0AA95MT95_9BACI|nr:TetR/AcrR family transcriptional regulator [Neobacillus novalis]WHY86946.1 helix-turn-helix domain-containing protein [Neobacillus novalis]